MNSEQVTLVQTSFAKVAPIADTAATLFYDDLFDRNPKLKTLFKGDMDEQKRKLMTMLGTAVAGLRNWDRIAPAVQDLGRRHVGYGVTDADYDTVGAALLATLEKGLGPDYTPEVKAAWIAIYTALAGEMKGAASAA